jgi:hypothetical protein
LDLPADLAVDDLADLYRPVSQFRQKNHAQLLLAAAAATSGDRRCKSSMNHAAQ